MRNAAVNRITEYAKENKNVFLVTGDAGFGVLDKFRDDFGDRFLNLGVAEQNMISFSAGLALTGYKVFVYNIIPFLLYRCYEQVRNDICYQRLPITLVGIGSGVTYAPAGVTHYSVEDIGLARTLPNLVIISPADPIEADAAVKYAIRAEKPVYIRLAKTKEPLIHKSNLASIEKPIVIKGGSGVAVLFHGSVSSEIVKLQLDPKCPAMFISIPMLQPLDFTALIEKLKDIHTLVTVEEHFSECGLGAIISDWITKENRGFKLRALGIKHEFIHAIKNNSGMRCMYGICSDGISGQIMEAFKNG